MKSNFKVAFYNLLLLTLVLSCKPSACDCANLYDSSPMSMNYTYQQLNDSEFMRQQANNFVRKAKKCAIEFGDLSEFQKGLAKDVLSTNMIPGLDKAIRNAKKECANQKTYEKNELEIACDCWNQSVLKSGKAFDDMTKNQQDFRMKCFGIFSVEEAMRDACIESKK